MQLVILKAEMTYPHRQLAAYLPACCKRCRFPKSGFLACNTGTLCVHPSGSIMSPPWDLGARVTDASVMMLMLCAFYE